MQCQFHNVQPLTSFRNISQLVQRVLAIHFHSFTHTHKTHMCVCVCVCVCMYVCTYMCILNVTIRLYQTQCSKQSIIFTLCTHFLTYSSYTVNVTNTSRLHTLKYRQYGMLFNLFLILVPDAASCSSFITDTGTACDSSTKHLHFKLLLIV